MMILMAILIVMRMAIIMTKAMTMTMNVCIPGEVARVLLVLIF